MTLKTMLLPIERHDQLASVFDCAATFARHTGASIEAVPVRSLVGDIYIAGAFGGVPVPQLPANDTTAAELRRLATTEAQRAGLAGFSWRSGEPLDDISLAAAARVYDVSVFGRARRDGSGPRMAALETTLFEAGRPILIAPPVPPSSIGTRIAIAWNGSTETARTVAFAMPLLERAASVLVLSVESGMVPGPSGAELAVTLKANGVPVEERIAAPSSRSTGEVLLSEAMSWGADLMIKGAYTQSRLRQMIFGGATSHILLAAELPVFMAH